MFDTITNSVVCTIVWAVIALVVFWTFTLPRTLGSVAYMSVASFVPVTTAVFITMIGVGITGPKTEPIKPVTNTTFQKAFLATMDIVFTYAGQFAFPGFLAEMKDPKEWPKSLAMQQISDTTLNLVAAIVIYYYAGDNVKSPALGSASKTVKKVAWGIAIPTIIIAGVILGHVASTYLFVRIFRGTKYMGKKNFVSTVSWIGIIGSLWFIAFVIAESIPDFSSRLGLIAALFVSWFTFGLQGFMWMHMNRGQMFSSPKKIALFCAACFKSCLEWCLGCVGPTSVGIHWNRKRMG